MMADDDLLDDDFDYEDYDITNEKEEALLQDDEDYSKSRDSYDDKKEHSSGDEDEEDVLNLDIEEDFQDVDDKALCEEPTREDTQPKFATTDKSQNSNAPAKTGASPEKAPAATKKTNNVQQKVSQKKRVAHQNDKWKRGNGRGRGNFQNRSNFVKNNTQRRRNGTVFVNPRYEGTVHINENSAARLAWDNDPQNHQNNLNFVPPWVSQNTQDQMLISNLMTGIASNFAVPNLLLPQIQPPPQNFYQQTHNYERQLSFEPPPNIDVQTSQPLYHQNQVSSQQMYPPSQPHSSTFQPYSSRGTSQEFNNQQPTGRMHPETNSFNSYSNHYDRPNNQRNYSLQHKKNSYGNENYNYNRPNTRSAPYNNNKNNSRPTTFNNNNYSLQSGNMQNKSTHYMNNGGYQNRNLNYGSNISKQQEDYNSSNTNYYGQNNLNRNANKQGNENIGVNYNTNLKQNENTNTSNNDLNSQSRQQNHEEFNRQNNFPVQKNTQYVSNKNFNERRNRRPASNENSNNRDLLAENKPKVIENLKSEPKKVEIEYKTQPVQNFPVKQEVEEDEETRLYRIKIEEQKKERERVLRIKEERRKQMLLQQKKEDEDKLLFAESGKPTLLPISKIAESGIPTQLPISNKNYSDKSNNFQKSNFVAYAGPQSHNQYRGPGSDLLSGSSNSDLAVELPQFTFKVSNVPQGNTPITKDVPKNDVSSGGGFMSNRVILVKSKNKPKIGILPSSNEPNVESSDVGQGNSSFFNNRKVLKKDNSLLDTRLVVVNNLSATVNQNKLMALTRGIGEIQTLRVDRQERQATILFRSVASAHAFYKKYQRRILDDLSVIEVTLEPMI